MSSKVTATYIVRTLDYKYTKMNENDKAFKQLQAKVQELQRFVSHDVPHIIGVEAVEYARDNIDQESYDGKAWPSRKDNKPHKLLAPDPDFADSLAYEIENGDVNITSDRVYAQVHNDGLRAGRGTGFEMPQRQFIGDSTELKKRINKEINRQMKRL